MGAGAADREAHGHLRRRLSESLPEGEHSKSGDGRVVNLLRGAAIAAERTPARGFQNRRPTSHPKTKLDHPISAMWNGLT